MTVSKLIFPMLLCLLLIGGSLFAGDDEVLQRTRYRGFMVSELTPEIVSAVKNDWNANIVRLQLIPLFWAPVKKMTYKEAWQWMMQQLPGWLDNARDAGILVVIDLHNVPRALPSLGDKNKSMEVYWSDDRNRKLLIQCWEDIAAICKDRPEEIWFDLKNEPLNWNDMPSFAKEWPRWAQDAIDAIRKIDSRHTIVVEPGPGGLCWGFKDFPLLKDHNIIYSAHHYQPHEYAMQGIADIRGTDLAKAHLNINRPWPGTYTDSEGGYWDKARFEKELAPVIEFQKKHKVRIYIGEFSVVRWAPNAAQYLKDCIDTFEKYGWDWTYHAFRESKLWSLEHENTFTQTPEIAKSPTDRAVVVRSYMEKNKPAGVTP